jgi:DNA-binding MarR family transcriptional regulator
LSREEQIKTESAAPVVDGDAPEPVQVQINITLQLDEVAEVEADRLKQDAHRPPRRHELIQLAGRIYDARRTRDKMLGRRLFGEPAWDMLLALYCLPARGELLGVTALTHAANTPEATGHRWQQTLTEEGLIERGPPGFPARKQIMKLTTKGRELMERYLTRLFYADAPTPLQPRAVGG